MSSNLKLQPNFVLLQLGKTTLSDALVAHNGIISQRMAGKLRYMDSRKDEQERGITMKSSAVSLAYQLDDSEFLVNLIDSPGHVDFSSEVSTAVRLCDGAIVVVDVVEGVQPQTKVVLQQTWKEAITPVLVLNKIDRLILEMKFQPLDAYIRLCQVLEQVNAVIGELFTTDVLGREGVSAAAAEEDKKQDRESDELYDFSSGLDDADDSRLYFSPEQGNVLFASSYDGWAFDLGRFAQLYSEKLGFSTSVLMKTLWGDFYVNSKTKKIMRGAQAKAKKPLFVQLILENVWAVYESAVERKDKERLEKMISSLGLKVAPRDLRSSDPRQQLYAVMSQWLPLAPCLLQMICRKVPAPNQLNPERVERLMCSKTKRFDSLPEKSRQLKEAFLACSGDDDAPLIVFISKMFAVPKSQLPENRPRPLTQEQLAERRERARQRLAEQQQATANANSAAIAMTTEQMEQLKMEAQKLKQAEDEESERLKGETAFIAFARVFSGNLKPGRSVYVLGPKYDPAQTLARIAKGEEICSEMQTVHLGTSKTSPQYHIMKATVEKLYLLIGRDLEEISSVSAGNIVGLGGLENYVLKSSTLSSDPACPAFVEDSPLGVPILRVAVEPARSSDMNKLVQGLHLLNQADANVQVYLTEKGEHILVTAGEVHLERCLRDLQETFAGVEVNASAPIVPFRETIVPPPATDMVNEELSDENKVIRTADQQKSNEAIVIHTPNKKCCVRLRAAPIPPAAAKILDENGELFRALDLEASESLASQVMEQKESVKAALESALAEDEHRRLFIDRIWSLGPKRCGPNLLINNITGDTQFTSIWKQRPAKGRSMFNEFESSIVNGFQLATLSGPLMDEPLMGVAFIIDDFTVTADSDDSSSYGPLSGQIVSSVKEGCRRAFQAQSQRIVAAMYSCDIQVKSEALGKLFASLGKRNGKVVMEEMVEGSSTFVVTAHLPVAESFQFAQEIRRQTSGLAMPQLFFSHWEIIDLDPFWVPQTEEEITHFGDKADSENQARRYMNDVRKRKGLAIDEKIVEFAEKQRTLTKMK